jgi:hypothetical protein
VPRLEAENLVLRQQLNILIRKLPKRMRLANSDRLLLVWLYRLFPSILSAVREERDTMSGIRRLRGFSQACEGIFREMRCAKCGSDNPLGKKFCGDLRCLILDSCPKCGVEEPGE